MLASASSRRFDLLRTLGLDPEVRHSGVPEDPLPGETPEAQVLRLAEAKGRAVAGALDGGAHVILAADTAVILDDVALGKPADRQEAAAMLSSLAGREHVVLTGVFVMRTDDGRHAGHVERTKVRFRDYGEAMIRWYVGTDEPLDKAGAYGIQTRGALLAEGIEGSWTNVVGLPIERLPVLMRSIDLDLIDYLP